MTATAELLHRRAPSATTRASTLSIVIPAYNEEDAIAAIIERTLAARESICVEANLSAIDIIVVSDGSTDRTAEIAGRYREIRLIAYEKNRGYGAAIKTGFSAATGDLLAFLDADGTCDPLFFGQLCRALDEQTADIAIGARLGRESEMPRIRRLGNRLYAAMLNISGAQRVTDSASGMRVMRRTAIERLYPLPDGMHFTPAMSSIALFDPALSIVEVPMRYSERVGESKLSVVRDGLRFLKIIADTAFSYRPLRFFGVIGFALLVFALAYGAEPLFHYLRERRIEQWMFYRLSAVAVAITAGFNLILVGLLAQQAVSLIHEDFNGTSRLRHFLDRVMSQHLLAWGAVCIAVGLALNGPSIQSYITSGNVTAHWIHILVGGLLVILGVQSISFGVLARTIGILTFRRRFAAQEHLR